MACLENSMTIFWNTLKIISAKNKKKRRTHTRDACLQVFFFLKPVMAGTEGTIIVDSKQTRYFFLLIKFYHFRTVPPNTEVFLKRKVPSTSTSTSTAPANSGEPSASVEADETAPPSKRKKDRKIRPGHGTPSARNGRQRNQNCGRYSKLVSLCRVSSMNVNFLR